MSEQVRLVIEPGHKEPWVDFKERIQFGNGIGGIAVDGFVDGPPASEDVVHEFTGRRLHAANLDHHQGVDREITLSSSQQMLLRWSRGLRDKYTDPESGDIRVDMFVNDSDPDVADTYFVATHSRINPVTFEFIAVQGLMDITAGGYPFDTSMHGLLERHNWIHDPFHASRKDGRADSPDPEVHREIIEEQCLRMDSLARGEELSLPLDLRYNVIKKTDDWWMIEEVGSQARLGAVEDGARLIISYRQREDGTLTYSFFKLSSEVDADFNAFYAAANELEGFDAFGGSTHCGGSGRKNGSRLSPELVGQLMSEIIHQDTRPTASDTMMV